MGSNKTNSPGCLASSALIIIIGYALGWVFKNVVGVLGIVLIILGIYVWYRNKIRGVQTRIPSVLIVAGIVVSVGWFAFELDGDKKEVAGDQERRIMEHQNEEEETTTSLPSAPSNVTDDSTSAVSERTPVAESKDDFLSLYQQVKRNYEALNNEFRSQSQNFNSISWGRFSRQFNEDVSLLRDQIGQGMDPPVRFHIAVAAGSLFSLWRGYDDMLNGEDLKENQELINTMKQDIERELAQAEKLLQQN